MIELPQSILDTIANEASALPAVRERLLGFIEGRGLAVDVTYHLTITSATLAEDFVPTALNGTK